jgi:hypothetical protein
MKIGSLSPSPPLGERAGVRGMDLPKKHEIENTPNAL